MTVLMAIVSSGCMVVEVLSCVDGSSCACCLVRDKMPVIPCCFFLSFFLAVVPVVMLKVGCQLLNV